MSPPCPHRPLAYSLPDEKRDWPSPVPDDRETWPPALPLASITDAVVAIRRDWAATVICPPMPCSPRALI